MRERDIYQERNDMGDHRGCENTIQQGLFALQDLSYRDFQSKLMPTVDKERVIGVRTPALRKFAKELAKDREAAETFMDSLPHTYYEEDNVHGELIGSIRDYDTCVAALDRFLPYVDNWATCDMMSPKVFRKHRQELLEPIGRWLASDHIYTVRFAIKMLMDHYLEEDFAPEYLEWVAAVESEEYYLRMMQAWYFATALAKQYEAVVSYLVEHRLELWTHNKTIQKAVESYRITPQQKEFLRTLRRRDD